ncbi:glycosyl transferase [Aquaticitalea lipolytica]|uniref:Glycosyl transferase n=1 Tax=Aquaticitalea lipolytica TaxID=1247562 RepID=A0A8J2TQP1_9FLAO|nr:glycosyltransferase [Aquaticitalea lipolytica]GFZ81907.1 glycosyl transferase [Aquaticitalea lipolytica]
MTTIAVLITIAYLILIGYLIVGFDKIKRFALKDIPAKTKFTVVIPFRNEAEKLPMLLQSISELNYPKALFEIIFIDDESDDHSVEVIKTISKKVRIEETLISIIKNERKTKSPKKDAITAAILKAKHKWIITTDADCVLPKFWLDSFDEFIQQEDCELIVAPLTYSKSDNFLERFQLLDILSLQGSTIGGFGISRPFLCNGANLAYKKSLFNDLNGFDGNTDIASGDDIFLLEKAVLKHKSKVRYLKCEHAIVTTQPERTWKILKHQRMRWAAKTSAYKNWFGKFVGIIIFLMNGGLMVFGLMTLIGIIKWKVFFYILIIKFAIDALLLFKTALFFNQKESLKSYPLSFFLYPLFSVYIVFISVFKTYKWKGRPYTK